MGLPRQKSGINGGGSRVLYFSVYSFFEKCQNFLNPQHVCFVNLSSGSAVEETIGQKIF